MNASTVENAAANLIELRGVSYQPPGTDLLVLRDCDLQVRRGETLVLLGESGCGKTTTLRLMNALLLPTRGSVAVDGALTSQSDAIQLRRGIGYVLQDGGLFPHFSVARNIAIGPLLQGWDNKKIAARVREMLQLVGLDAEQFGARLPGELSGGQRQRIGVARALATDPKVLLMDEPFGALDPITREEVRNEFRELTSRLETTVVLVTHDVREALLLGDRVALMRGGQIELLATPDEFVKSENEYARAYYQTLET